MEIANDSFELLLNFPEDEKFGLTSQISRCSISIPSNIAEGSSRTEKSFAHYIDISLGSSFELETQLLIAIKRNDIKKEDIERIQDKLSEFQKMSFGFQKSL